MPIHDWSRVDPAIFHDFRFSWVVELARTLNRGALPSDHYALIEPFASGLRPDILRLPLPEVNENFDEAERYCRRQNAIAVRRAADDRIVVAVQVLSPVNKSSNHMVRHLAQKAIDLLRQGVHLLLLDLSPPGQCDPSGIHGTIWDEINGQPGSLPLDKPLALASYEAGPMTRAYVEPVAVGDVLPDMPLFLGPWRFIDIPLERSYQSAWEGFPRRWKCVIESPR